MSQTLVIAGQVVQSKNEGKQVSIQSINMYNNRHPYADVSLFRHITLGSKLQDSALLQRLMMNEVTFDYIYNTDSVGM